MADIPAMIKELRQQLARVERAILAVEELRSEVKRGPGRPRGSKNGTGKRVRKKAQQPAVSTGS